MSGPPRLRSLNCEESESRPVLGPAGNNARTLEFQRTKGKVWKTQGIDKSKAKKIQASSPLYNSPPHSNIIAKSILKQQRDPEILKCNLSLNASCSSDASSDSSHSRASTGRFSRRGLTPTTVRGKQSVSKSEKSEKAEKTVSDSDSVSLASADGSLVKKRCAWVTPTTDTYYAAFHDEEWGVPVHDDKKLFELLSLCTALAELTWPAILSKRHIFREVFQDFDPFSVSKFNEKKLVTTGGPASSLLSELRIRAIIENAHQVCKVDRDRLSPLSSVLSSLQTRNTIIINELGSFDKYIWGFVNHKSTVSQFRYPRQVPIKTSKADVISKDLVKRGFRGVGPTVVYSFMQVAGITSDHLISCFRFQECVVAGDARCRGNDLKDMVEDKQSEDSLDLGLARDVDELSLSTDLS